MRNFALAALAAVAVSAQDETPAWSSFSGDVNGTSTTLWALGVKSTLSASGSTVTVGGDNRTFVFKTNSALSSTSNTLMTDLLGGSLSYDVDLSGVGC